MAASLPALKPLFSHLLATTKTALGLSESTSRKTPNPYPANSAGSGFRRQYDPRVVHEMFSGMDLNDYEKGATVTVESGVDPNLMKEATLAKMKRAYQTRITSGDLGRNRERSWGEGFQAGISRSDSEERLHPAIGIYKTMEISTTSEMMGR